MGANDPVIFLADMDGSIADYAGELERRLRLLASEGEPEVNLCGNSWEDEPDYLKARMALIKRSPGFWSVLPKMDDGFEIMDMAQALGMSIHILTKGPRFAPIGWTEKMVWCESNIPYDHQVTITMDKGLVYGRVLMDDYPEYALRWLKWRKRGQVIMPDRPWNRGFDHPQVYRYTGDRQTLRQVMSKVAEVSE